MTQDVAAGGSAGGRLQRDYRPAFLLHLSRRDERSRAAGYELGRRAVARGAGLLELVAAHHVTLLEVLPDAGDAAETESMCTAASEFLTEVLSSFAMATAALPDLQAELRRADGELAELRARVTDEPPSDR